MREKPAKLPVPNEEGHFRRSLVTPATLRHKWRANQSKPSVHPFPCCFPALVAPEESTGRPAAFSSPVTGDRSGLPRTDTHHSSSYTKLWRFFGDLHGYRSSRQAHRGMCHVTTSPFGKILLFFAPGNLEGTGLFQHHSN